MRMAKYTVHTYTVTYKKARFGAFLLGYILITSILNEGRAYFEEQDGGIRTHPRNVLWGPVSAALCYKE
jgi:hypothetical protein